MLLAIEQGNSNTVFAMCHGANVLRRWRVATNAATTAEEHANRLEQFLRLDGFDPRDIEGCIISSVAPAAVDALRALSRRHLMLEPLMVGETVHPEIEVRLPNPRAVGVDRLLNAISGFQLYGGPLLIVDAGTATKFDVVASDGGFEGGVIAPGLWPSAAALAQRCALLTDVAVQRPAMITGRSTVEALQSGIYFGFLALVEGVIERVKADYRKPLTVVATGGVSAALAPETNYFDCLDVDLTVKGLIEVHRRHQPA